MPKKQKNNISHLLDILDSLSPFSLQESWDNSGLILGSKDGSFKQIYVALEVTQELLEQIKKLNLTQDDFESPDLSHEGCQMAHIFERLCGFAVISQGYMIVDCTYGITYSRILYLLLNLKKFIISSLITVRVTKKKKLLIKVLRIPVFAMKLKNNSNM